MTKVTLFYRDGDNYKCTWDVQVPDEVIAALPDPDVNGQHDIADLGLSIQDIPLVQQFGYDESVDHPFVTIEEITPGERVHL